MDRKNINIVGAGGHAKVVIEMAELLGYEIDGIYDDDPSVASILDYKVNEKEAVIDEADLVLAMGSNFARKQKADILKANYINVIHPNAILSKRIKLGNGNVVMAGVVINSSCFIGNHCIINTSASIDHDCVIGDFVHIAPKVGLAGGVHIGEGSHVGIGATVKQQVVIGKWCTIGAGSVVIDNIADHAVVVGNPAKVIRYNDV